MDSFYEKDELAELGLKSYGEDVLISRKASIYSASCIEIGSHVRIDDFCILSGRITLEDYIHISAGVYLFGGDVGITFRHHSSISSQSLVYAITDDYSGEYLTNSTVEAKYRHVLSAPVTVEPYCVIGAGTIILPGVSFGEGCAVGAGSLITKSLKAWTVYMGVPAKEYKRRSRKMLEYVQLETKDQGIARRLGG